MIAKLIDGRRAAARLQARRRPVVRFLANAVLNIALLRLKNGTIEDRDAKFSGLRAVLSDCGPSSRIASRFLRLHGAGANYRTRHEHPPPHGHNMDQNSPSQNWSPVRSNRNLHGAVRGKQPFEAWHVIAHRIDLGDIMHVFRSPAHYLCRTDAF